MPYAKVGVMLAQLAVYAKDEKEPDVTEYDVELPQRKLETFKGYNRHMEYRQSNILNSSEEKKVAFANSSARTPNKH